MNQLPPELTEEAPLDPAAERVRRKMVRLLAVSIGIMFIGIFAVLGTIVWQMSEAATPGIATGTLTVPAGFSVVETAIGTDTIALRGTDPDGRMRVLLFDADDGTAVGAFAIGAGEDAD